MIVEKQVEAFQFRIAADETSTTTATASTATSSTRTRSTETKTTRTSTTQTETTLSSTTGTSTTGTSSTLTEELLDKADRFVKDAAAFPVSAEELALIKDSLLLEAERFADEERGGLEACDRKQLRVSMT